MLNFRSLVSAAAVAVGLLTSAAQPTQAAIVPWTGSGFFNEESIEFGPVIASRLAFLDNDFLADLIGLPVYAAATSWSDPVEITISLLRNDLWTDVYSDTISEAEGFRYISDIGPINFELGTITGIKFSSDPGQDPTFWFFSFGPDDICTFICTLSVENFDEPNEELFMPLIAFEFTDGNQIPEPGTLALLGAGLFGLGLARRRKAA